MLTDTQVEDFVTDGPVRVAGAVPRAVADDCRAECWRATGCDPDDPSTWTEPVIRLDGFGTAPFREAAPARRTVGVVGEWRSARGGRGIESGEAGYPMYVRAIADEPHATSRGGERHAMQTPDTSPDITDTERPHSEFAHRSWPADVRQLPAIREDVRGWLRPLELTEGARQDLVLAVSEAASNALAHAYPEPSDAASIGRDTVEMTYWIDDGRVWIEIVDQGAWVTPKDSADGHGLGIPMMQRLVDSVMIQYGARGTSVLMSHPLPGEAREVPDYPGHPARLRVTDPDRGRRSTYRGAESDGVK